MKDGKPTDTFLEWYPGNGPHHKDPHWKFSNGETGTSRVSTTGVITSIAIAAIPGATYAQEGDWNGAARDVVVESTPLAWSKMLGQAIGAFYEWVEKDIYGEEYHKEMQEYRKEHYDRNYR